MIRNLLKRIFIAVALLAAIYGVLQIEKVQIKLQTMLLTRLIHHFTPYAISNYNFGKTYNFPFEVNISDLTLLGPGKEPGISFKNIMWKIPSFSFSDISLRVEEVLIRTAAKKEGVDFTSLSPGGIAIGLHKFINYLQWFESVDVTQLKIDQKTVRLNLKRVGKESVVTLRSICHSRESGNLPDEHMDPQLRGDDERGDETQPLVLTLTQLSDHTNLHAKGEWLAHPISLNAQIYENAIDFAAEGNIGQLVKSMKDDVHVTGRLVKDPDWQLKPLKMVTSSGHVLEGECFVEDPNHIKLRAKLQADAKNTANIDVSISLNPFEIDGSTEIAIEDLQKFLQPFLPDAKGNLKLQASLRKVSSFEKGNIQLHAHGLIQSNEFHLPISIDVDLHDGLGQGKFNLTKEGGQAHYQNHPLEVVADFNSTAAEIHIEKLKLQLYDLQMALLKPSTYNWQNGLANAKLQFCGGTIEVSNLKLDDIISPLASSSGTINLRNIQLAGLKVLFGQEKVTGLLNGQLQKLPQKPLTFKLNLTQGFWQKHQNRQVYKILNNLSANLDGNFDNSICKWKLGIKDKDKINLESTGNADFAIASFDAHLKGLVRLSLLTDWLGTGDRIFGDININLHGKGAIHSPVLEGSVDVDNGLYEHNEVGTFYQNITIRTKAQGHRLVINRFDAKDATNSNNPASGQLRGEGWIDFSDILTPVFHVPMQLNHLRISQNDGFTSDASGTLLIAGKGADVGCKGEVTLEKAEYFIIENSEKMIPGIVDQKDKLKKIQPKNTGTAFPLDILVHVPAGSFKVTGSGANTIWKGDIYVKKSIINPFLVGSVELHEGTLVVLGKVLKITKGVVTFVDDDRNNPRLDIIAVKDLGDGVIVAIEIKGTSSQMSVDFTSTPSMAKEEVLALLLFGKKLGEVSVLQSIQLAELTKSNQTSSKAGFFEQLRNSLGFDQFEFKTITRGGAAENDKDATPAERAAGTTTQAVRIGKEFGKVQVGIEQGAGSETSKVIVSTPLGNHLVLQGDVGAAQNSGVGISWIKRY